MLHWVGRALAVTLISNAVLAVGPTAAHTTAAAAACTKIRQSITDGGKSTTRLLCLYQYASYMAVAGSGNIFVTVGSQFVERPTMRSGVVELSPDGVVLGTFGGHGSRPGQFESPGGIAVDRAGNIYVADSTANRIEKFSPSGQFITQWSKWKGGAFPSSLNFPIGVAVDPRGHIWVSDFNDTRIVEFTSHGRYLGICCKTNKRFQGFIGPMDLQFDAQGDMYVGDHRLGAVFMFGPHGNFIKESHPTYDQNQGIAVDSRGDVYEAASGPPGGYIPKFDHLLNHIANIHTGNGGADLVVDRAGNLYIADDENSQMIKTDPHGNVLAIWR